MGRIFHAGTRFFQPKADGVAEEVLGAEAEGLGLAQQQKELIHGQLHFNAAEHLFFHPSGDVVHAAFPFVDGGRGAIAEEFGKGFPGECAGFAQVA